MPTKQLSGWGFRFAILTILPRFDVAVIKKEEEKTTKTKTIGS